MNPKFLKRPLTFLFLLSLGVAMLGVGCEKEDEYDSNSLIGKWKLVYTYGGVIGVYYPPEGMNYTIEFTVDSMLIQKENEVTTFEVSFSISGDTIKYLGGLSIEKRIEISNDTLSVEDDTFKSFYKRIN